MDTATTLAVAAHHIAKLAGHTFDIFTVGRPKSMAAALNLLKIISKVSPLVGNLVELEVVEFLNTLPEFEGLGTWVRQDPEFPDTIFRGEISPPPGLEIKAWFPLATEITARFRDSQARFAQDETSVALLAWMPENLLYGRPRLLDACVISARSVAEARDKHYHRPPHYLVIEPEDTSSRTRNLRQTNTAGYRWQGSPAQLSRAQGVVNGWGPGGGEYSSSRAYQDKVRALRSSFPYRLDTNFAKLDRIEHQEIEAFKTRVLGWDFLDVSLGEWSVLLSSGDDERIAAALARAIGL